GQRRQVGEAKLMKFDVSPVGAVFARPLEHAGGEIDGVDALEAGGQVRQKRPDAAAEVGGDLGGGIGDMIQGRQQRIAAGAAAGLEDLGLVTAGHVAPGVGLVGHESLSAVRRPLSACQTTMFTSPPRGGTITFLTARSPRSVLTSSVSSTVFCSAAASMSAG